jgi:Ribosomal protein L20
VDSTAQCGRASVRLELQSVHRRARQAGLLVDRKVLSDLAIHEPAAFAAIVEKAKVAIAA